MHCVSLVTDQVIIIVYLARTLIFITNIACKVVLLDIMEKKTFVKIVINHVYLALGQLIKIA
jgi:hypothetical protein